MFDQLTSELLDLTASVQGHPVTRYAMLCICSSCCCSCGTRTED